MDNFKHTWGFPCGSAGKESICNVGDLGSIPGLGRSPGEGKAYLFQYSGLENSIGLYSPWCCRVGHNRATFTFQTFLKTGGEHFNEFPYIYYPDSTIIKILSNLLHLFLMNVCVFC